MAATFLKYTDALRRKIEGRLDGAEIDPKSWDKLKALLIDLGPFIWSGRSWQTTVGEISAAINRSPRAVSVGLGQLHLAGIIEKQGRGRGGVILRYLLKA